MKTTGLFAALLGTATTAALAPGAARAEIKVDPLIGDHMVVQRDRPVKIGGTAAPGETVTATLAAGKASAKADAHGRWSLALPALTAGGPFTLRVSGAASGANSGANTLTFSDVLSGEVWVASGQSNMELPLQRTKGGADAAALGCSGLRLFTVGSPPAAAPATKVGGEWRACDAASAPAFSAAAFFFARDIHRALGVPVGIVQSSVGGTPAEAWTPREALRAEPTLAPMVEALDRAMNDAATRDELTKKLAAWEAKNFYQDEANQRAKAEKAGWARSGGGKWTTMQIPQLLEAAGMDIDGAVWFRRDVTVPEAWAGKDLALSLGAIDDFDVTYWNGERVGATGAETPHYYSVPRHYQVPAKLVKPGRNVLAVRVFDHFGGGGFAGTPAQMNVRPAVESEADAPIALAGAWSYKVERKLKPIVADWNSRPKMMGADDETSPTVLWNGMVAPLAGTPIAGVIWYQGESNVVRAAQYRTLFPAMIRAWRAAWGDAKLPFLFVQLPNFEEATKPPPGEGSWAELREAQALALREPRTAMAVTLDIGEAKDIHPREKREVGRRLALAALKMVYGRDVIASGPTFAAAIRDGAAIKLRFANVAGGLTTSDGAPPKGFLIAGADRVWKPADARIEGAVVIVTNAEIAEPIAVRYGWGNDPGATLRNQADLPAAPFRTDDWATASVTATAK